MMNLCQSYVAELGFKLATPGSAVRIVFDCTMKPGLSEDMFGEGKQVKKVIQNFTSAWLPDKYISSGFAAAMGWLIP